MELTTILLVFLLVFLALLALSLLIALVYDVPTHDYDKAMSREEWIDKLNDLIQYGQCRQWEILDDENPEYFLSEIVYEDGEDAFYFKVDNEIYNLAGDVADD